MQISVLLKNGSFMVESDGEIIAEDLTNAQAWRLADKLMNEPTSRQECVNSWKAKKEANDE